MTTQLPTEQLTEENRAALAKILGQLDPTRPYGPGTAELLAPVTVSTTWQPIWLRMVGGHLCVWLRLRGPHEKYPGQYSAPSNAMLPRGGFEEVMERIRTRFFGGQEFTSVQLVGNFDPTDERGCFVHMVYLVDFAPDFGGDKSTGGDWYPVGELPPNLVSQHVPLILAATAFFGR